MSQSLCYGSSTRGRARAAQTPVGSKPRAALERCARKKVSPVSPAGFPGPLGVAVTKQTGRKMLVTGIAENASLLV